MIPKIRVHAMVPLIITLCALLAGGARAQDVFGTLSGAHFDVRYQRGVDVEDARKVLDFLQAEYNALSGDLGLDLRTKLEVRMYESVGKFLSESTHQRPWRGAFYSHGILYLQPVSALVTRNILEKSITYELALAILEQSVQKGCPRWLAESFAAYYSAETAGMTPPLGARLSAFSDLNQDIQQYPNPPQRDDVHFILGATMTFFVQKYGEKKAFHVFRNFDGMTGIDVVFKRVYNQDYTAIEKEWAKYIASRTASFK